MSKVYLTLEQAQALIPKLKKDMIKLMKLNKILHLLNSVEVEYDDEHETLTQDIKFNKEFHRMSFDFYKTLDKLHSKGCFIKDLNRGIADFYSKFQGREIFLCWKYDEKEIKYWHEIENGYSGRKPVSMIKERVKNR